MKNKIINKLSYKILSKALLTTLLLVLLTSVVAYAEPTVEEPLDAVLQLKYLDWYTNDITIQPGPYIARDWGLILNIQQVRAPQHNSDIVIVIVEDSLWDSMDQSLITTYADDVETQGYGVYVWIHYSGDSMSLRNWIITQDAALSPSDDLAGCVFIGDLPEAWYEMDTQWDPLPAPAKHEEFPIELYYMDLDGSWTDSDTDGLWDDHTGDMGPEIWVGRIKADAMSQPEVGLVENYFQKNHDYRTGDMSISQRALVYVDDDWQPATSVDTAVGKAFSTRTHITDPATTNDVDYLGHLASGYSFVHLMCHGNSQDHTFKIPNPSPPPPSVWDGGVTGHTTLRTNDPPVQFYNLFVCSGARFTDSNYLAGWCIFTPTSGLAAIGSTKTGSMGSETEFYTPLGEGKNLGDAFREWFDAHGEDSRAWFYGMALMGDPTLRVSGKHQMTIEANLPDMEDIVHYQGAYTEDISLGEWSKPCGHGTQIGIKPTIYVPGPGSTERYLTEDVNSWYVAEPRTFTVNYHHQYLCEISVTGLGPDMATVTFVQNGEIKKWYMAYSSTWSDWCDEGSTITIENPVIVDDGERYSSTDQTSWTVSGSLSETVNYYHQFETTVKSSGDLLDATHHGTTDYTQYGVSGLSGIYYDDLTWSDWCDSGTTLTASQIVSTLSPVVRYHTDVPVSWSVTGSAIYTLPYHTEYKVTIEADGLPPSLGTTITVGTADWSPSYDVAGGDVDDYQIPLTTVPKVSWTNWVHADTSLDATPVITVDDNEKYVLVCWTKDGVRHASPTIEADLAGVEYIAHYAGIKKTMSPDDAGLCEVFTVTIELSNPPLLTDSDTVFVADDLPNELSYVYDSAMVDGNPYTPLEKPIEEPEWHERVIFEVDGDGKKTITFDAKVNRAHATDTTVKNYATPTFDIEGWDIPVGVFYEVVIHPYEGPTLSKVALGPTEVPVFTEVDWVFRFIVKNNYDEGMTATELKDNFGAELVYDPNTIIANLYTDPYFYHVNGKSKKVKLLWTLLDIDPGEAYALEVTMSTGMTPSKVPKQAYTSPGVYALNSGATLKWLYLGKKQSLETGSIYVTAYD